MNVYAKQNQTHRHRKQTCGYQRGKARQEGQIRGMGLTQPNFLKSCLNWLAGFLSSPLVWTSPSSPTSYDCITTVRPLVVIDQPPPPHRHVAKSNKFS